MIFKKVARFILYFICAVVLLLVVAQITFNHYINRKIITYLQTQISESTHGGYSLQLQDVQLSLLKRSLVFDTLKFLPTGNCTDCKETQYSITADDIRLEGLGIIAYFKNKEAVAQKVEFGNLTISIFQGTKKFPAKSRDSLKTSFSLYNVISKKLSALTIHNIEINNAKIRMYQSLKDPEELFSSEQNDIEIKNFTINQSVERLDRMFLADTFNISMKTFSYTLNKGLYMAVGHGLNASYTDSTLTIDSLALLPNYKKAAFGPAAGYQVSRVDLHTGKMSFTKMNVKLFIEHNWFVANKLNIDGLYLDVYRDKNIPFKNIVRPSMSQLIRQIPFFISIDSVQTNNGNIVYEDVAPGSKAPGKLTFTRLNSLITGLQNDTSLYNNDSQLKLKAQLYIMDAGRLDVAYSFLLNTRKEQFTCVGTMGGMRASVLNPVLENSAHVKITQGNLDSASFSFAANEVNSKGSMMVLYHDLHIELLNKDDHGSDTKHQLMTFIANKFILKDSNPKKGDKVRVEPIYFERNPYRFFIYYTWKSMQSALMPMLGLKNMKMGK